MRRTDAEFMKRDNGRNDCVYYHFMNVKANDNDTKGMNVTKIFKVMREVRAGAVNVVLHTDADRSAAPS